MNEYIAYIDESGDPVFSSGSSLSFFVGAVFMPKQEADHVGTIISEVKSQFKLLQLKSNKVQNFDRRLAICKALNAAPFQIATIQVNKEQLYGDWFKVKQTFFKYFGSTGFGVGRIWPYAHLTTSGQRKCGGEGRVRCHPG